MEPLRLLVGAIDSSGCRERRESEDVSAKVFDEGNLMNERQKKVKEENKR